MCDADTYKRSITHFSVSKKWLLQYFDIFYDELQYRVEQLKEGIHERCRRQNGSAKSCRFLFALRLTRKGRPVFLPPRKALINIVIQCLGEDHRFKEVFSPRVTANRIAKYGLLRIRKKCRGLHLQQAFQLRALFCRQAPVLPPFCGIALLKHGQPPVAFGVAIRSTAFAMFCLFILFCPASFYHSTLLPAFHAVFRPYAPRPASTPLLSKPYQV